jgi:hypothetical protein
VSLKKKHLLSFFSVFLLIAIIAPVSADITFHFTDRSFLGTNPVTITGQDGSELFNGTTASTATIPSDNFTASYWVSFEPGGYTDYAKHPEYTAKQTFDFGAEHIVGAMVIVFVGGVWFWRKK